MAGSWTLENIQSAKRLVREIVKISELKGTLRANDVDVVISQAREIMAAVKANKPAEEILLPL